MLKNHNFQGYKFHFVSLFIGHFFILRIYFDVNLLINQYQNNYQITSTIHASNIDLNFLRTACLLHKRRYNNDVICIKMLFLCDVFHIWINMISSKTKNDLLFKHVSNKMTIGWLIIKNEVIFSTMNECVAKKTF